jgi:outer membrane protein TolC
MLAGGCATRTYEARPIDPTKASAQWRERSLADPALLAWVDRMRGSPAGKIDAWGLPELTLASLYLHPDLELARARLRAAEAAQYSAGLPKSPRISGLVEHHSKADGISPWSIGVGLEMPIRTDARGEAQREHSAALTEVVRLEVGAIAWQVRNRLRAALIEHLAAEAQLALLQSELDLREEATRMIEARLVLGAASLSETGESRLQLGSAAMAYRAGVAASHKTLAELAAALGLPADALAAATLDPAAITPPAERLLADDVQQAALLNRIDLRVGLAHYAAAEARLRLEIARQVPEITLGPGFFFDQGDRIWSLGASLLLALSDHNAGPIAEAEAQREVEGRRFLALQARVIGEQAAALRAYRNALRQLEKAGTVERAAAEQVAAAERRVTAGQDDRLDLVRRRLERVLAGKALLAARFETQRALGALEDAVQQPLDGSAPLPDVFARNDPS